MLQQVFSILYVELLIQLPLPLTARILFQLTLCLIANSTNHSNLNSFNFLYFLSLIQRNNLIILCFLPFAAGGIGDITFRLVTGKVSERTGMQFVIDNRPGAGGINSALAGKQAAADGYTLVQIGNSYAISASLFKTLPYDLIKDFTGVSMLAQFDMLLATKASGSLTTVEKLLAYDKANPGKLNFGAISAGSTQNLAAEMFKVVIGSEASVVPFKSSPELINAIQRGDVDVGFDYLAAFAPLLAANEVKLIASAGEKRSTLTPDTPTVAEGGVSGYVVTSWNGVAAPAGTPREIVTKLNQEIDAVLQLPELREQFRQLGMETAFSTPDGMGQRLQTDIGRWRGVISKLGLQQ
jgi:tripartite-type tricarboxylate transporter receptor subunit TctC